MPREVAGATPTRDGSWTAAILDAGRLRAYQRPRDLPAFLTEAALEVVAVPAGPEGPAVGDDRVVEADVEASYRALATEVDGRILGHAPRTREGRHERLQLLYDADLRPRRSLGGSGRASPVDVMDATVLAWTAWRVARGVAVRVDGSWA